MSTDVATALPVFAQWVPTNHLLAQACLEYRLDSPQLLLVVATNKDLNAAYRAAAKYGVRRQQTNATPGFVNVYATSIVDFARDHPNRLLARPGTGSPHLVTDDDGGPAYTPWADLGEL